MNKEEDLVRSYIENTKQIDSLNTVNEAIKAQLNNIMTEKSTPHIVTSIGTASMVKTIKNYFMPTKAKMFLTPAQLDSCMNKKFVSYIVIKGKQNL